MTPLRPKGPPYAPKEALTPSTMIQFTLRELLPALLARTRPQDANARCRQDLRRYYWLLAVSLESAPPIPLPTWHQLLERCAVALAEPTSQGDLTATLFAAADLLPIGNPHTRSGWTPIQLLALADCMEATARLHGVEALPGLAQVGSQGRVRVRSGLVRAGKGGSVKGGQGQKKRGAA